MTKSYSPTEDEVLKALRYAQQDRNEAASTELVHFCIGPVVGLKFDDSDQLGSQTITQGSVLQRLEALAKKNLVYEVVPNIGYDISPQEKFWITTDRYGWLLDKRETARQVKKTRDEAQRAVQARLKALGIESYIAGPETLRVSVEALEKLLARYA